MLFQSFRGVYRMTRSLKSLIAFACFVGLACAVCGSAQNDTRRTTIAITYPLDQTIEVPFHGTVRLPRLKGSAKVRRQGRRGTRVEVNMANLPRAEEMGGGGGECVLLHI